MNSKINRKLKPVQTPNRWDRRLVGQCANIEKIRVDIKQVAKCSANVFIHGESGTGKEVVAHTIHAQSSRGNQPFVPINCGAIPADLLESELFGHEKGSFTGAITARIGRFAMADGGTLFLDEIAEMTMAMQVKLLRVIEERSFERVGGTTTIYSDVRIIAATNCNLEDMIKEGKFRQDLFFRLNVFPITLPPLRDHICDLPFLVREIITRLENSNKGSVRYTNEAINAMATYDWPGNVRELSNHVERMSIKYPNGLIQPENLSQRITKQHEDHKNIPGMPDITELMRDCCAPVDNEDIEMQMQVHLPSSGFNLKEHMAKTEKNIIKIALKRSNGVIAHAAKTLGMRRTTLAEKLRKYQIERNDDIKL